MAAVKLGASRLRFNQSPARSAANHTWHVALSLSSISCTLVAVALGAQRLRFNQPAARWQPSGMGCRPARHMRVGQRSIPCMAPLLHHTLAAKLLGASHLRSNQLSARRLYFDQSSSTRSACASTNHLHVCSSQARRLAPLLHSVSCTWAADASHPRLNQSAAKWQQSSSVHRAFASINHLHVWQQPHLARGAFAFINQLHIGCSQARRTPLLQSTSYMAVDKLGALHLRFSQSTAHWPAVNPMHGAFASITH